jgi:hypothetical protein
MKTLLDLQKRPGDAVLAEDFNALLDWLRAVEVRSSPGVRVTRTSAGTFITATASALPVAGAFDVTVTGQDAQIRRGLVEGIEPVIKDVRIGGDEAATPPVAPPVLKLPAPTGAEGYIYLEAELNQGTWRIAKVEPKFYAAPPSPEPWKARKLLAILRNSGNAWEKALQAVHFNMGHYAYGRRPNGRARHLWFAR